MKIPCKAKVLNFLIEAKEFRIIPTPIWRNVQTNADLPVESRFLWTVLWELCAPNPNFEKPLTWSFLSKRLGKSESTIRRWARSLQKFGYLEIRNVFADQGGQLPSVFRIGVPIEVAELVVTQFPDRRKPAVDSNSGVKQPDADNCGADQPNAEEHPQAPVVESVAGVVSEKSAEHAEFADNVRKIGVENSSREGMSRLTDRISAIGKGSNRSQVARSREKQPDVLSSSDRFAQELLEIRQRASKMGATHAQWRENEVAERGGEGAVKSVSALASTFGTQDNNPPKQENNKNTSLRSVIRRAIVLKLGARQDVEKLVDEFAVSIEKGAFKKFDLVKAINIGLKLVREGRWVAPRFAG